MTKRFLLGFCIGLAIFVTINLISAHLASNCGLPAVFGLDSCSDDIARAGWPFQFYEEGGFAYRHNFNGSFLFLDVAIGLALSAGLGWIYSRRKPTLSK